MKKVFHDDENYKIVKNEKGKFEVFDKKEGEEIKIGEFDTLRKATNSIKPFEAVLELPKKSRKKKKK